MWCRCKYIVLLRCLFEEPRVLPIFPIFAKLKNPLQFVVLFIRMRWLVIECLRWCKQRLEFHMTAEPKIFSLLFLHSNMALTQSIRLLATRAYTAARGRSQSHPWHGHSVIRTHTSAPICSLEQCARWFYLSSNQTANSNDEPFAISEMICSSFVFGISWSSLISFLRSVSHWFLESKIIYLARKVKGNGTQMQPPID